MSSVKPTVYIETSVVSYLTSRPSRDLVVAGNQVATKEWWDRRREAFELVVSELVEEEAGQGDAAAADRRLAVLESLPVLRIGDVETGLAAKSIASNALPESASADALHVAIVATNSSAYLLTWNCTHLVNAERRKKTEVVVESEGFACPTVCTPLELMGEQI